MKPDYDEEPPYPENPPWTMFFDGPLYERYREFMANKDFSQILLSSKLKMANQNSTIADLPDVHGNMDWWSEDHDVTGRSEKHMANETYNSVSDEFYKKFTRGKKEEKHRTRRTRALIFIIIVALLGISLGAALIIHYFFIPPDKDLAPAQVNISFSGNTSLFDVTTVADDAMEETNTPTNHVLETLKTAGNRPDVDHTHTRDDSNVLNPDGRLFDEPLSVTVAPSTSASTFPTGTETMTPTTYTSTPTTLKMTTETTTFDPLDFFAIDDTSNISSTEASQTTVSEGTTQNGYDVTTVEHSTVNGATAETVYETTTLEQEVPTTPDITTTEYTGTEATTEYTGTEATTNGTLLTTVSITEATYAGEQNNPSSPTTMSSISTSATTYISTSGSSTSAVTTTDVVTDTTVVYDETSTSNYTFDETSTSSPETTSSLPDVSTTQTPINTTTTTTAATTTTTANTITTTSKPAQSDTTQTSSVSTNATLYRSETTTSTQQDTTAARQDELTTNATTQSETSTQMSGTPPQMYLDGSTTYKSETARIVCKVADIGEFVSLSIKEMNSPIEVNFYSDLTTNWSSPISARHDVEFRTVKMNQTGELQTVILIMKIASVVCRDAREYRCILKTRTGELTKTSNLIVVGRPDAKIELKIGPSIVENKALRLTAIWQGGYPIPWTNISWTSLDADNSTYNLAEYGEYRDIELKVDHFHCETFLKSSIVIFPRVHLNDTTVIVKPDMVTTRPFVNDTMTEYLNAVQYGVQKILVIPLNYCQNGGKEMSIPHPYTACTKYIWCLPGDLFVQQCPQGTCFYEERQECL